MKFRDFANLVRTEAPGAPDFLIERSVRDTAIDFCRRTGVYIPEPENVTVIKGVRSLATKRSRVHLVTTPRETTRLSL